MADPEIGDRVFAKLRGFSPWPAIVISKERGNKFKVYFSDKNQNATVKKEFIWGYKENEELFATKYHRSKPFMKALKMMREMEYLENNQDQEVQPPHQQGDGPPLHQQGGGPPLHQQGGDQPPHQQGGDPPPHQQGGDPPPHQQGGDQPPHQQGGDLPLVDPRPQAAGRDSNSDNKIEIEITTAKIKMTPEQLIAVSQQAPGFLAAVMSFNN